MIGVIDILRDDATLGALVGGTGTSARVYPIQRAQKGALPAVTVTIDAIEPYDTKSGVSTLDEVQVSVVSYGNSYDSARQTSDACRGALDRTSGTYNTEVIQSIQFQDQYTDIEEINNASVYFIEQIYNVRLVR